MVRVSLLSKMEKLKLSAASLRETYIERNESLEGPRLDHEALIGDILDDPIEYLTLDGSEDEGLELDLVDDLTGGVLNAPI